MHVTQFLTFDSFMTPPFNTDAVDGMVRVADYINEMQRISETYSSLFDDMMKNSGLAEVSPGTKNPASNIVCIARYLVHNSMY